MKRYALALPLIFKLPLIFNFHSIFSYIMHFLETCTALYDLVHKFMRYSFGLSNFPTLFFKVRGSLLPIYSENKALDFNFPITLVFHGCRK